jgi:hypothetical protein
MLELSQGWLPRLESQPESGPGYRVATVFLRDGTRYEGVVVVGATITAIAGSATIPFVESEIADILVTQVSSS